MQTALEDLSVFLLLRLGVHFGSKESVGCYAKIGLEPGGFPAFMTIAPSLIFIKSISKHALLQSTRKANAVTEI